MFFVAITLFSFNPLSVNSLECVSLNNQVCKIRIYPFGISINKCSGSCDINDPYAKLCVPNVVENINVKVFNLSSRSNQTRRIKWHESCKYKCRLDSSVRYNKHRWNEDKCRCGCKELIDKERWDKGFIWNPSHCNCKCDKSYDVGEYL